MKTLLFIFISSLMFFVSCDNKKNAILIDSTSIVFDLSALETAQFENIIDSVGYLKLELDEESPIARISKIALYDSLVYILDTKSNIIFVYNKEGKFRFKISRQGLGPEEYASIEDFTLTPSKSTIDLLDVRAQKVLQYDMLTGNYVQTYRLNNFSYYLLSTDQNKYLLYDNEKEFFTVDVENKSKETLMKFTDIHPVSANNIGYLYKNENGNPGCFSIADNSMYSIENGKMKKIYSISFDGFVTPADFPGHNTQNMPDKLLNNGIEIMTFKELSDWIFLQYGISKESRMYSVLYDKKSGKKYSFNGVAKFPGFLLPESVPQETLKNCLVMTSNDIPIESFKSQLGILPADPIYDKFKNVMEGMSEDDNPLLQLIYLKE